MAAGSRKPRQLCDGLLEGREKLARPGFTPDIIVAHHGWGESLFFKEVWPDARLGLYCEFYHRVTDSDVDFDPEFARPPNAPRMRLRHLNNRLHADIMDAGLSPTAFQAGTFPAPMQDRITAIHDGIDTDCVAPDANAQLSLPNGRALSRSDEVVTFVIRNLEPYRGYHIFMRALPDILRQRPKAQMVLVGGDGVSYGVKHADGGSWKQTFIDEVRPVISDQDWDRVHFVGIVPYTTFLAALQVSTVHVYLTYPFVPLWSLLEAMSTGCAIVASPTPHQCARSCNRAKPGSWWTFLTQQLWHRKHTRCSHPPNSAARLLKVPAASCATPMTSNRSACHVS